MSSVYKNPQRPTLLTKLKTRFSPQILMLQVLLTISARSAHAEDCFFGNTYLKPKEKHYENIAKTLQCV